MTITEKYLDMLIQQSYSNEERVPFGGADSVASKLEMLKPEILSNQEKAEKYDMMERSFNVCIAEKIELHGYYLEYQTLKSGLEKICNSIDYDYNPMDTEERMKKLLEKIEK